jgi:hypothetical protein
MNVKKRKESDIKARDLRAAAQPPPSPLSWERGPQTDVSFKILEIRHKFMKLCINPLTGKCLRYSKPFFFGGGGIPVL